MKVLWTINILPFKVQAHLHVPNANSSFGGGWLMAAAQSLISRYNIELHIACPSHTTTHNITVNMGNITYHAFPSIEQTRDFARLQRDFNSIIAEVQPDLVDLHGTEYAHSLACLRAAKGIPSVVTLQGIISECAKHYYDALSCTDILFHLRPFHRSIYREARLFQKGGVIEKSILQECFNIIGRTKWDKSYALHINPDARYFHCNESLRDCFYNGQWEYESCEAHSMFFTQAAYPLKGLHQLLKAMPSVIKRFPDSKLYIGGDNILEIWKKHRSNYNRIIVSLIEELKLQNYVIFTGPLNEQQMKDRFLKSNVFVSCSSIENSPNSLSEAQMLGVPCIASCVGGVPDMIPDKDCGTLYRFEDINYLSYLIGDCFENSPHFDNRHEREVARQRHDRQKNADDLINIYKQILG